MNLYGLVYRYQHFVAIFVFFFPLAEVALYTSLCQNRHEHHSENVRFLVTVAYQWFGWIHYHSLHSFLILHALLVRIIEEFSNTFFPSSSMEQLIIPFLCRKPNGITVTLYPCEQLTFLKPPLFGINC